MKTDGPRPVRNGDSSDNSNVISLDRRLHDTAPNSFKACRDLNTYWDALRGVRMMPARSEFDPRGIEQTLACTFIAEKVAPSVARVRVAGSVMNDALGMDVRGMPITAFFDPMSRDSLSEATRDLFTSPAMVTIELSARRGFGRKPLRARMVLLPLSDEQGHVTRLVGCLDVLGGLDKAPRRFKITSIHRTEISGEEPIPTGPHVPFSPKVIEKPAREFAFCEAPVSFRSKRRAPSQEAKTTEQAARSGLRLVVSNA